MKVLSDQLGGKVSQTLAKAKGDGVEDPVIVLHETLPERFFVAALPRSSLVEGMKFKKQPKLARALEQLQGANGILSIVLTKISGTVCVLKAKSIPLINPELN